MGITTAGLAAAIDRLIAVDATAGWDYLELGTDSTAFAVGQTALVAAITDSGLARAQDATTTSSAAVGTIDYTWTASGSKTLREIGLFNASSAGDMLARTVMPTARAITSGATYKGTITLTLAAA